MKNKFLPLVGSLSALVVSPISNAMQQNAMQQNVLQQNVLQQNALQQNAMQQNNAQLKNTQNSQQSQNGFTKSQVAAISAASALLGAGVSVLATKLIDQKALDDANRSLEDEKARANSLQAELNDKNKKIKDFEKQVEKLDDENKKLKKSPPQPGGFSAVEKQKMQNKIKQLEEQLANKTEEYNMLLNKGEDKNLIATMLIKVQQENETLRADAQKLTEMLNKYEGAVGPLEDLPKDGVLMKYKLELLAEYFPKFYYGSELSPKYDPSSYKQPFSPLAALASKDYAPLKRDKKYTKKPLQSMVNKYKAFLDKNAAGDLERKDYSRFLHAGFGLDNGKLDYQRIFLNLKLLYSILDSTSNVTYED